MQDLFSAYKCVLHAMQDLFSTHKYVLHAMHDHLSHAKCLMHAMQDHLSHAKCLMHAMQDHLSHATMTVFCALGARPRSLPPSQRRFTALAKRRGTRSPSTSPAFHTARSGDARRA